MSKKSLINMVVAMAALDEMFENPRRRGIRVVEPTRHDFSTPRQSTKVLSDYYTPPRSMTEAEQAHYAAHKNLTNFKH